MGRQRESVEQDLRQTVGSALRALRERRGLSQDDVSELSRRKGKRFSKSQISQWEKGKRMPQPRSLAAILTALGSSAAEFCAEQDRQARQQVQPDYPKPVPPAKRSGRGANEVDEPFRRPEERYVYVVRAYRRDTVTTFEAGPPDLVFEALRNQLEPRD